MTNWQVIHGDCIEVMRGLPESSVDAIVTDPPYGLAFMGKAWDHAVPGPEFFAEMLRVAKPGAHLLSFGGTRLYHRMTCAIEDAGWEVRDCLMWLYGSGFPKSHDVSKAIGRSAGAERNVVGIRHKRTANAKYGNGSGTNTLTLETLPATDAAKQWHGWGTALKPAWEPIVLARKPLDGTVANNVLTHGCGGINVDGCRVGTEAVTINTCDDGAKYFGGGAGHAYTGRTVQGRWPANLILDADAGAELDAQAGNRGGGFGVSGSTKNPTTVTFPGTGEVVGYGDKGGPSRFFYCPKASKADRGESNNHPTVKPTDLMAYLCRLITPPGGVVLDPFCGSGSTGKAAAREGFGFVGIEQDAEYAEIARARIAHESATLAEDG